jgi:hypothetical protein
MVDVTALLVAIIGVAGTISVAILTVFWQVHREKIERTTKQRDLRRALYSELGRVLANLLSIRSDIEKDRSELKNPNLDAKKRAYLEADLEAIRAHTKITYDLYQLTRKQPDLVVLFYAYPEAYIMDSIYESVSYVQSAMSEPTWKPGDAVANIAEAIRVAKNGIETSKLNLDFLSECCVLDSDRKMLRTALGSGAPA